MQYYDYAFFEEWVNTYDSGEPLSESEWLHKVLTAQDLIQNKRAEPVVNTGIGAFWYALSSLLLIRENGRGIAWSQKMLSDDVFEKLNRLDLGNPLSIFTYKNQVYQREWEKGKVIVNPSDTKTENVSFNQYYEDIETGEIVNSLTLKPKTGKILMLKK